MAKTYTFAMCKYLHTQIKRDIPFKAVALRTVLLGSERLTRKNKQISTKEYQPEKEKLSLNLFI